MIQWTEVIPAATLTAEVLTKAKAAARAELAARIEAARTAMITDLPGQSMIYMAKEAEARAWLAEPAPDPADYPMLSAEVGITAPDADSLAQLWLNMAVLWRSAAAGLEALRLTAAAAIEAAGTVAEVDEAMAAVREA